MADELKKLDPKALAAWYGRLADIVAKTKKVGGVTPLASIFMREWLKNRNPKHKFQLSPPEHLRKNEHLVEKLKYHRAVYLTEEKVRVGAKANAHTKWAGVVPRLQGKGYAKWDGTGTLSMHYEGNVDVPVVSTQLWGSPAEVDVLYGMGTGFQLKTMVDVTATPVAGTKLLEIRFTRFDAGILDRYDWNKIKTIKVPNPDFGVRKIGSVAPHLKQIQVYHSNAIRLEKAKLAAPFDIESSFWNVTEKGITASGRVDPSKRI